MGAREELRTIFSHLKETMALYEEIGLDPPPVTRETMARLERREAVTFPADRGPAQAVSLEALRAFIGDCRRCKLHLGRTHLVFGEGPSRARLVFVGEGPGRDEDQAGRPFVGEAGKLLTRIIQAMGLEREEVYICNVVKCRPPRNRDPEGDEVEACMPFLKQQIGIIGPDVICTLGRVAGQGLLGPDFRITRDRGTWRSWMDTPVMPTFHPAYLLRNPAAKRDVWEDVQKIMKRLDLEVKRDAT